MAQASERIINIEGAERKIKQLNESVIIVGKAIDHLISAVTEATKAIQEYQSVTDGFMIKGGKVKWGK